MLGIIAFYAVAIGMFLLCVPIAVQKLVSTIVTGHGNQFTFSQILRLLLARAIVTRPHVLIVDGTLHSMAPSVREVISRRLCSKDEPWSIIFVSNDPNFTSHVDRRITLQ
jgi:ABC-type bacteriocin/lantibiotic exporter with double-glycine peptidase domain